MRICAYNVGKRSSVQRMVEFIPVKVGLLGNISAHKNEPAGIFSRENARDKRHRSQRKQIVIPLQRLQPRGKRHYGGGKSLIVRKQITHAVAAVNGLQKFKRLLFRRRVDYGERHGHKRQMRNELSGIGKRNRGRHVSAHSHKHRAGISVLRGMGKGIHGRRCVIQSVITAKNQFHMHIIPRRAPFYKGRAAIFRIGHMMFLTVRGNRTTSRMFSMPVTYMTKRSKPSPKPPCGAVPNFLRSRYCS